MKSIAFVDFDHNIYDGDSMLDFLKLAVGKRKYRAAILRSAHFILGYKLNLISGHTAKEALLKQTIQGQSASSLKRVIEKFTTQIDHKVFPKAKSELQKHKSNGVEIVIVSASSPLWLKPWCDEQSFKLIATELETQSGLFTGKLKGKNCKGFEKVKRIQQQFDLSIYDQIYAYGDDKSDIPMLGLANQACDNLFD